MTQTPSELRKAAEYLNLLADSIEKGEAHISSGLIEITSNFLVDETSDSGFDIQSTVKHSIDVNINSSLVVEVNIPNITQFWPATHAAL